MNALSRFKTFSCNAVTSVLELSYRGRSRPTADSYWWSSADVDSCCCCYCYCLTCHSSRSAPCTASLSHDQNNAAVDETASDMDMGHPTQPSSVQYTHPLSQEFLYCLCLTWTVNGDSLETKQYSYWSNMFNSVAPPGFCNRGEVRYGSIGGLEYKVPQKLTHLLHCTHTHPFNGHFAGLLLRQCTHILHNFWTSTHRGKLPPSPLWWRHWFNWLPPWLDE